MTTWKDVMADVLTHFKANWDFETMPVQYQNKDFITYGSYDSPLNRNDNKIESYVRLSLEPLLQSQFEFSSGSNTRTTAFLIMMVMNRKNNGTLFFAEVFDRLSELYVNKTIGSARITNIQVSPYVYEDNYATQTITLNITFENIE